MNAPLPKQAVMAGLAGVVATAVDVAVLTIAVESGAAVAPAAWLGAICGAVVSFSATRRWAFRDGSPVRWQKVGRFAAVAAVAAMAMAIAMHLTAEVLGMPYLIAKALCAVVVFAAWTLPAQRALVFRVPPLWRDVPDASLRLSNVS